MYAMIFLGISCIWTQMGIEESLPTNDPVRKKDVTFSPLKTFKNLNYICRLPMDKGKNPIPYVLLGYFIALAVVIGNLGVIVFYTTYKFKWNAEDVGYYFALEGSVQTFSMLCLPFFLEKLFRRKIDNIYYISFGYLMRGVSYLAIGLSTTSMEIYLCTAIFLFTGPYYPRNRVLLSNSVSAMNQATMQSAIAAVDSMSSFVAPIFSLIYSQTVHESPSIVYYYIAALTGVAFLLTFYTTVDPALYRNLPESKERDKLGNEKYKIRSIDGVSDNEPLIRALPEDFDDNVR